MNLDKMSLCINKVEVQDVRQTHFIIFLKKREREVVVQIEEVCSRSFSLYLYLFISLSLVLYIPPSLYLFLYPVTV